MENRDLTKYEKLAKQLQKEPVNEDETLLVPSENISLEDELKVAICTFLIRFQKEKNISNKDFAEILNTDEPNISRLRNYRLDRLRSGKLWDFLDLLRKNKDYSETQETIRKILSILNHTDAA